MVNSLACISTKVYSVTIGQRLEFATSTVSRLHCCNMRPQSKISYFCFLTQSELIRKICHLDRCHTSARTHRQKKRSPFQINNGCVSVGKVRDSHKSRIHVECLPAWMCGGICPCWSLNKALSVYLPVHSFHTCRWARMVQRDGRNGTIKS